MTAAAATHIDFFALEEAAMILTDRVGIYDACDLAHGIDNLGNVFIITHCFRE